MADFLGGLLSGGGGLYDDLLTPQQRDQLSSRGLLSMAGAFAEAAMPSRFPVPLGAAIGKAAAAMSGGRDEAALKLLQGQKLSQEVQTMKMTSALQQQFMKDIQTLPLDALFKRYNIGGAGGAPAAGAAPAAALPGAAPAVPARPAAPPTTAPLPPAAAALPAEPSEQSAAALFGADSAAGEYGANQYGVGQDIPPPPTGLLGPAPSLPPGDVPPPEPPLKASSLGAPDTVLPRGPGGLLATPATYGGGAGTSPFGPGGEPTVRLAAATSGDPRGLIPYIRERAIANGIDPDVAVRVAQSEGLGTFQSSVIQRDGRREPSYGAMQLYTGGGMGNDFQRDTGLDPSDPRNERATIDYALSKAPSTGWTPWHGAAGAGIGPRTGLPGGPDYVIPSGRGVPANMLQQVADKGAAPGAPGGDGQGMNTLLLELAKRNAMAEILKLGNPYSSMLSVLQGSPEYQGQIEAAKRGAGLPFIAPEKAAERSVTEPSDKRIATWKAALDAANEEKKQKLTTLNTLTKTTVPDGKGGIVEVDATVAQAIDIAHGLPVPELGVKGMFGPGGSAATNGPVGKPVPSEEDKAGIQARGAAQTEMYKAGQKALDTAHDAVRGANQRAPYYGSMLTAMEGFKPGATAEARLTTMQYLRDAGVIKGDNVPQGEALRLAGERLAFLAVPPNQGSWSNVERQLLKSSIGGMSMTPEGLTDAIRMMQQLDDYDRKVSEIHRQVADKNQGLPNLLEAQRRVEALGPPLSPQQEAALERLRQPAAAPQGAPAAGVPPGAQPAGTYQGKPVYKMPDGSLKVLQ